MEQLSRHRCLVYDGAPSVHLSLIAAAVVEHLDTNYRCLYLNSPNMVAGLRLKLAACGVDVGKATNGGAVLLSSEQGHLINGEFDVERMLDLLRHALDEALRSGYAGLWASGDMACFGAREN
jgi:hypothetical protein